MKRDQTVGARDQRMLERSNEGQPRQTRWGRLWRRSMAAWVLALPLALVGCGGGDDINLTGRWTGTIEDSGSGTGSIVLMFSQMDQQVTGTWTIAFPGGPANTNGGNLTGTVSDPAITLLLTSAQVQGCAFTVAATKDNDDHLTGTYTTSPGCPLTQSGTLDVRR